MAAAFLVSVYFPIQALRGFLADATTRLNGQEQAVRPSAVRLSTWVIIVIFLQLMNAFSVLFPSPELPFALIWFILVVTFTALLVLPLLKLRQFAELLAHVLDEGTGGSLVGASAISSATSKGAQMGLLADEQERKAAEGGERTGRP